MSDNCILREDKNNICYLTLNRPDKLNALDSVLFRRMEQELIDIEKNDTVKAVVVKGAGRCFCAGHDVNVLGAEGQDEAYNSRVVSRLADLKKPVIAVIHGHCYTGALELMLAADIVIASENAKIGDTHSKFALYPIWGLTQRLARRIGEHRAKDMFFTNRVYSGREALQIGLAEYCFADDEVWDIADEIAQKCAASSDFSNSYFKKMLRETDGQNMSVGLLREVNVDTILGPDFEERISVLTKKK